MHPAAPGHLRRCLWLGLGCALLQAGNFAYGQEPRPAAPAKAPVPVKPPLKAPAPLLPGEVKPDLFLLQDKEGNLQKVLGFTFEDFIDLHKLKNRLDPQEQRPRFTIETLTMTGQVRGQRAEIAAEFGIVARDAQWLRVPLRMDGAVLAEPPKFKGPGEQALLYEQEGEGYVSWIRSEPGKTLQLSLRLLAPVASAGIESQVKLRVPRATLSKLSLQVPVEKAVGRLSESAWRLESKSSAGKTEFSVAGLSGEVDLSWRAADTPAPAVPVVLEASGAMLVRIDGRSVNTEARLSVRSFGGGFDHFRVRLPPGAELIGSPQSAVALTSEVVKESSGVNIVEIKLKERTPGPVDLRLVTERPHTVTKSDETLELAGFDVLGAIRQWGHVAVQVVGSWQVHWGPRSNVRQVDDLPESLRRDDLTAGFEYFVQPCSLTARVVSQTTRIAVDPDYTVQVAAQRVQLAAKLRYKIRGAKVRTLSIDVPGWEVDEVGPASLVNSDMLPSGEGPAYVVTLQQASAGDFELTMNMHRTLAADAKTVDFELPRPAGEAVSPATVVVLPADNVELAPDFEAIAGLASQPFKPQIKLPDRHHDPLYFRQETNPARFAAGLKIHTQTVTCEAASQVAIDEKETRVDERLVYQVAYEPIDKLVLEVPRALALDKLRLTVDGQKLLPLAPADESVADDGGLALVRVSLPAARIGRFELQAAYRIAQGALAPGTSVPLAVPLIMPADGRLSANRATITTSGGITIAAQHKGGWQLEDPARAAAINLNSLSLFGNGKKPEVTFAIHLKEREGSGSAVVDRGWIQTWLTDSQRQDRAVFRFSTNEPQLRLQLPGGVVQSSIELRLDGKPVAADFASDGGLTVSVPASATHLEHVLEADYRFADRESIGRLSMQAPRLGPNIWVRRLYWQLVLPANEHLLLAPTHLTREFTWTWSGGFWRRQSVLDQAELEQFTGVSAAAPLPAGVNSYLFSAIGACESIDIWTVRRGVLVFTCSLALLLLGLGLIYAPRARHPATLFVAAVLLLAGTVFDPETAVLIGQASVLGLVLSAVAVLLARGVRAAPVQTPRMIGLRASVDRSATEAYFRAALPGSHSSTATAPVALHLSTPDVES